MGKSVDKAISILPYSIAYQRDTMHWRVWRQYALRRTVICLLKSFATSRHLRRSFVTSDVVELSERLQTDRQTDGLSSVIEHNSFIP